MIRIRETEVFKEWIKALSDRAGAALINIRLYRLRRGNPGKTRGVGDRVTELKVDHGPGYRVTELKVDHGPGYRVYYTVRGEDLILLLCGGDKTTQAADIKIAGEMAKHFWENEDGEEGEA